MIKKRGLGKNFGNLGLNELLSELKTNTTTNQSSLRHLPVAVLQPGQYQPRREFNKEALEELASSIRTQGIIQPIVVRPIGNGAYEIIAGERRWRAAQLAELHEVPTVIREISDEQVLALSLIENIQREDLNAIDTAAALQRLIDEFGMTHQHVAEAVGKSRVMVTNLLRLLGLHEEVKKLLQHGEIEMGHARALLALESTAQIQAAKTIVLKGLSVRATESLVRSLQKPTAVFEKKLDPNIAQLQQELSDKLAARVALQHSVKSGRGKLTINYNSLEELEGILAHIR